MMVLLSRLRPRWAVLTSGTRPRAGSRHLGRLPLGQCRGTTLEPAAAGALAFPATAEVAGLLVLGDHGARVQGLPCTSAGRDLGGMGDRRPGRSRRGPG